MAGLHVHLRPVTLAVTLAVAAGSCSCPARVLDDAPEVEPACLWLISPYGYRADGTAQLLWDARHRRTATVCLCLTQAEHDALGPREERVRFPEEGTLLEDFNELAYDECKRLAASFEGLVADECLDYYQHGTWLKDIYLAEGAWASGTPPGFSCDP
jgi:hypothetical protein